MQSWLGLHFFCSIRKAWAIQFQITPSGHFCFRSEFGQSGPIKPQCVQCWVNSRHSGKKTSPERKFPNKPIFPIFAAEMCQSGRMGRTRNAKYGQLYQGFESLHLRTASRREGRVFGTGTNEVSSNFKSLSFTFSSNHASLVNRRYPSAVLRDS
jgi:hypothetical protein